MKLRCPAKINTFLSVGPPDKTGYHPVRTVYQSIGLFDEMTIEHARTECVTFIGQSIPHENTVTKALRLLRELVPIPPLNVTVNKHIPSEAGLGGGSSDAAAVVRYAAKLFPDVVTFQFANEVARAVGADVPFFLVGGRARGTGYGDVIEPLHDPDPYWVVVAKPACGVSTPSAYSLLDSKARRFEDFSDAPYNDFERVAPCESLDLIGSLLSAGAKSALLCGSGSSVYGAFTSQGEAKYASSQVSRTPNVVTWVAPTWTRMECLWTS